MTRADCQTGGLKHQRPCPIACRYRLDDSAESCALDVADRGPHTLAELGTIMDISRERVRQIEFIALRKIKAAAMRLDFGLDDVPPPRTTALEELAMSRDAYLTTRDCDEINQKCDAYTAGRKQ